jgi:hypothetical protein
VEYNIMQLNNTSNHRTYNKFRHNRLRLDAQKAARLC